MTKTTTEKRYLKVEFNDVNDTQSIDIYKISSNELLNIAAQLLISVSVKEDEPIGELLGYFTRTILDNDDKVTEVYEEMKGGVK